MSRMFKGIAVQLYVDRLCLVTMTALSDLAVMDL